MSDSLRPVFQTVLKLLLVYLTSASPLSELNMASHEHSALVSSGGRHSDGGGGGGGGGVAHKTVVSAVDKRSVDMKDDPQHKRWQMAAWGKRDNEPFAEKKWTQMSAWGKRDAPDFDKKWDQMSAWGKREDGIPDALAMDKKWKQMSAWGKRNELDLDKKWSQMSAWGKRDDSELDKKWSQMSAWGKRDELDLDKKWSQMSAWGKRDELDLDKKWNQMSAWGKRDDMHMDKKWKQMSAWGKRDHADNLPSSRSDNFGKNFVDPDLPSNMLLTQNYDRLYPVPRPTHINGMKMKSQPMKKNWGNRKDWGKRPSGSWSRTGFSSWGKRSVDSIDLRKLKSALLSLKPALGSSYY